jgi:predicted PurR-regulated permease PerM
MMLNASMFLFITLCLVVWLIVLSFFLLRMIRHYNMLTKDISNHGLKAILEQILKRQQSLMDSSRSMQKTVSDVIEDGSMHIQKIGLVRFNPFSDTGGSQSFTLALLDSTDTGLVMTSLYARTGNRWYVKEVKNGKGNGLDLSKEEQSAIAKARSDIQ